MDYEIGDEFKYMGIGLHRFTIGKVYEVEDVYMASFGGWGVILINDDGYLRRFHENRVGVYFAVSDNCGLDIEVL